MKTTVKAKAKAKPKKNWKPRPSVLAHAALAEKVGVDTEKATNYVRDNDDPQCPVWSDVKRRRTCNIRNGVHNAG